MHRRMILFGVPTFIVVAGLARAQLAEDVYQAEAPTVRALESAQSIEEVMTAAAHWNEVFHNQAGLHGEKYQSEYDKIVKAINDKIWDYFVQDPVKKAILRKVAPKLLAYIEVGEVLLAPLGPIFVAIEVMEPSQIATDAYEIEQSDVRVQKKVREAINRIEGPLRLPTWYDTIKDQLEMPPPGPIIQQP